MRVLQSNDVCPIGGSVSLALTTEVMLLLVWDVRYQIPSTLNAFRKKYIASGGDCDDVRVLAEGFEGNGIVYFSSGFFPRIIEFYQIRRGQRFACNGIRIIMLSEGRINCQTCFKDSRRIIYFSQGMILTRSKTLPVPSAFLAQTG